MFCAFILESTQAIDNAKHSAIHQLKVRRAFPSSPSLVPSSLSSMSASVPLESESSSSKLKRMHLALYSLMRSMQWHANEVQAMPEAMMNVSKL